MMIFLFRAGIVLASVFNSVDTICFKIQIRKALMILDKHLPVSAGVVNNAD